MVGKDSKGDALPDGWKPQPFCDANDDPSALNDNTCVIALGGDQAGVEEVAKGYHTAAGNEVERMKYRFYYAAPGQIEAQIRKLTKNEGSDAALVILDIPDDGGYYNAGASVDAGAIKDAIAQYEGKKLDRQQM